MYEKNGRYAYRDGKAFQKIDFTEYFKNVRLKGPYVFDFGAVFFDKQL